MNKLKSGSGFRFKWPTTQFSFNAIPQEGVYEGHEVPFYRKMGRGARGARRHHLKKY